MYVRLDIIVYYNNALSWTDNAQSHIPPVKPHTYLQNF